jgi:hypothetical protein
LHATEVKEAEEAESSVTPPVNVLPFFVLKLRKAAFPDGD